MDSLDEAHQAAEYELDAIRQRPEESVMYEHDYDGTHEGSVRSAGLDDYLSSEDDGVFAYTDWCEDNDLPITEDTADEFLALNRENVSDRARDGILRHVEDYGDVDDGRLGSRRTAAQATCPECGNPCGVEMEGYGYEEKYQEFPVSDCCSAELEDDDFYDDRADREYDAWRDDQMTGDDWHEGSRSWGRYLARLPRVAAAVRTAEEILAARFRTGSFNRENVIWQSPDGRWNRGFYREAELQHLAFGEVEAPENVDTLRDDSVDDGLDDFQYYIEPPSELRGPDISEAQRLDREQDDELVSDLEQQLGELGAQQDAVEGVPAQPMLEIRIPMPPGAGNGKYPPQAFQMGPAQPQSPEAVQSQPGMPPQQALAGRARR